MNLNPTIREVINILDIHAPITFTPKDQVDSTNYAFFRMISDDEEQAIQSGTYNPDTQYDRHDVGIHLPDMSVNEYYELENNRNPAAIDVSVGEVSKIMSVPILEEKLIFVVFCILHECGHWEHFLQSGKTGYEYSEMDKAERIHDANLVKGIKDMPDWDPYKLIIAKRYHKEVYSQYTTEKAANQYALNHIKEAINRIRRTLGYTEYDLFLMTVSER